LWQSCSRDLILKQKLQKNFSLFWSISEWKGFSNKK